MVPIAFWVLVYIKTSLVYKQIVLLSVDVVVQLVETASKVEVIINYSELDKLAIFTYDY